MISSYAYNFTGFSIRKETCTIISANWEIQNFKKLRIFHHHQIFEREKRKPSTNIFYPNYKDCERIKYNILVIIHLDLGWKISRRAEFKYQICRITISFQILSSCSFFILLNELK